MDERLQELLYAVQRAASDLSDAACAAGRRANEWVQNGRTRMQILDLRTEISLRLKEIGQIVYDTHTGNPTESEVLFAKLEEIDQLYVRMAELERQCDAGRTGSEEADFVVEYEEASGVTCPACGAAARKGDRFCRECGEALEQ